MLSIDNNILLFLHDIANQNIFLDYAVIFFAEYLPFVLVIIGILFIILNNKISFYNNYLIEIKNILKKIILLFIPAVSSWFVATIIKYLIKRPRPFIELSDLVDPLFIHGGVDSFPSGHATFFLTFALTIFSLNKKLGFLMIVGAMLIGVSRIISGIHFPIDIIGGFILSIVCFYTFNLFFKNKRIN